jgi:tRNA-uridine 2-sulfurtransferase
MSEQKAKLIVAMSGGVDSSVAAAICQEQGYDVIGATLNMRSPDPAFNANQGCCGSDDKLAAVGVAEALGIPHHFIDLYPEFEAQILLPCWQEYASGRTPNPCVWCNPFLKFGMLLKFADEQGAIGVATGHYARIVRDGESVCLKRGEDQSRDQSYFMYRLSHQQIRRIYLPLGEMNKPDVRELARKIGLKNSEKKDSQDACFNFPGETFPEILQRLFKGEVKTGNFIGPDGKVVGKHDGVHIYTIGQRKGLNVALGVPAYVKSIDSESGDIFLAVDQEELKGQCFSVDSINWQTETVPELPLHCNIQIRYRSRAETGIVKPGKNPNELLVELDHPQRAITTGQSAVFYKGDILLGGGLIRSLF